MYVYIAKNKKEFERVCSMLTTLNIKWKHKLSCGWNIEISLPIWETR